MTTASQQQTNPAEPVVIRPTKAELLRLDWADMPRLLTDDEVGAILNRSIRTVRSLRARGLLRVKRLGGGHPMTHRDDLRRFIESDAG